MTQISCVNITCLEKAYPILYEAASQERKQRADRYRRKEDALRCVASDALLRYALGTSDFTVEKTPSGKPFIQGKENFHYNLSHSGNWVAIAFGDSEVGIDVEQIRPDTNIEVIAGRFFAPQEQKYVFGSEASQRERFFEVWTGKESYLKYLGTGLQKNLTSFSIFDLESELKLHHRMLKENTYLCLCGTEIDYLFELLDQQQLR